MKTSIMKFLESTYLCYSKDHSSHVCSRSISPSDSVSWRCSIYSDSIVRPLDKRLSKRKFISRLLEILSRYNSPYFHKEIT